jgi:hypothetical protein
MHTDLRAFMVLFGHGGIDVQKTLKKLQGNVSGNYLVGFVCEI